MKIFEVLTIRAKRINEDIEVIPFDQWLKQSAGTELDEADITEALMPGTPYKEIPDQDMADYLARVKADALRVDAAKKGSKTQAASQAALDKWGAKAPAPRTDKEKSSDYYTKPHVHASSVKFLANGHEIDVDEIKRIITTRPKSILKQNKKMQKSGVYFNTRLPALKGLAVDEDTGKFIFVNTCPGAGECQQICYAKGGFYVVFKGVWEGMSQLLNFLVNDPEGFEAQLSAEIEKERQAFEKQGVRVNVRWHDAGDFFSPEYLQMAIRIAQRFPTVKFYCYTKVAGVALKDLPPNFDTNWSEGATSDERKVIRIHQDKSKQRVKHSEIVPREMFNKILVRVPDPDDPEEKMWDWKPGTLDSFKQALAAKYNIDPKSVLTYDEMDAMPDSGTPQWNVIVKPGEPDTSANRRDVIGTYLLQH